MKFEWDPKKAKANVEKHGVTFEEASTAFADWDSITVSDPEHSIGEERWYLLGVSERSNLLVVCHTERGDTFRIINNMKRSSKKSVKSNRATDVASRDLCRPRRFDVFILFFQAGEQLRGEPRALARSKL